jgi:hypothetical protein
MQSFIYGIGQMSRCFILSLIAAVSSLPALAEELPSQRFGALASVNYVVHGAEQADPRAKDRAALELYRQGLAYARRGETGRAFYDFNKALELEPALALAY